jgi:1,4-alpha-glucan branching enzyme
MPLITSDAVRFVLHDRDARSVTVLGSWNQWHSPGVAALQFAPGIWHAEVPRPAAGRYSYKFLLDGRRWLPDPANPQRMVNDEGQINSVFDVAATAQRERV